MAVFSTITLTIVGCFLFNRESGSAIVAAADYVDEFAMSGIGINYVPQSSMEELSKNKVIYIRHGKSGSNAIKDPRIGFYFKEAYDPLLLQEGWTQCEEK